METPMDQGVQLDASVSAIAENVYEKKYLDNVFSIQVFAKLLVPIGYLETNDLRTKWADDAVDFYRKGGVIK